MLNYQKKLADADRCQFSRPVTGFLLDVRPKEEGVRGAIFSDALKRFEDGDSVTITEIKETCHEHGYSLFLTADGCCYVAVSHLMFLEESFNGVPQTVILRAS
ncbi:hypothetical protein ACI2KG_14240 [Pseudomonas sp. NPDC089407]|uniref:hypothetical protein n=1 Tax=Pseudomonas sp. NPDC089407 TaxID=3364464 RepID=UPI0038500E71